MPWDNTTGEERIDPMGYRKAFKPRPGYQSAFPRMPPAAAGGVGGQPPLPPGAKTPPWLTGGPQDPAVTPWLDSSLPMPSGRGVNTGVAGPNPQGLPRAGGVPNLGQTVAASRPAMTGQPDPREALLRQLMGMG